MTVNDDPLFTRADAAIAAGHYLIRQSELTQQAAKVVCEHRLHIAVETVRILRRAERYMFEQVRLHPQQAPQLASPYQGAKGQDKGQDKDF